MLEQAVELAEGTLPREFKDESELKGISKERFKKGQDDALKMWPTPRTAVASMYPENPATYKKRRGGRSYEAETLANAANAVCAAEEGRSLWPTPVASDSGGSRRETARKEHWKSNPGETLTDAALKESWRTPTAREYKGASSKAWTDRKPSEGDATPSLTDQVNARQGKLPGRLNADWVEWLMGWPIGWTSLEPMDPDAYDYWEASIRKGPWWKSEPPDMVRIIKTQAKQGHRLKALGNGQVAMCAAAAFEALLETTWQVDQVIRRSGEEVDFLSLIGL